MKLVINRGDVSAGRPVVFLSNKYAHRANINVGERVQVMSDGKRIIAIVDVFEGLLGEKEVFLSDDIMNYFNVKAGNEIDIRLAPKPISARYITKKMNGKSLNRKEIFRIMKDIVDNALTEAEIAQFVVSVYTKGMSDIETIYLIDAMAKTGKILKWGAGKIIADKHSIGGIAANRTTPLVVSICAAGSVVMPKTSSRAITSAAGTADTMECVTNVDFSADELQRIVKKVGACLAWGGSVGLAPADDKLIKVERTLRIDPEAQLLASILSKKISCGSKYVLIDIPYGKGAKVSLEEGRRLSKKFIYFGGKFGLKMKVILTNGIQPIGNGIGPVLEIMDVLKVLKRENDRPLDLEKKAIMLAGEIFEMVGKAEKGKGKEMAFSILNSGRALKKFNEIIDVQGRKKEELELGKFKQEVLAKRDGKIKSIDNREINGVANVLGCPFDKSAGIYLMKHIGDSVKKGEKIAVLYAESHEKLKDGVDEWNKEKVVVY
jgi:AMP phosphorylase